MDVLNKDAILYVHKEHWFGGVVLGFRQTHKQKRIRGIIVQDPKAAKIFAEALLQYVKDSKDKNDQP